jgi:hypothetical protein
MASVLDGEAGEGVGGRFDARVDLADEVAHLAADGVEKVVHFLIGPFHDELDAAVRKIPDVTADVMGHGQIMNRIPEADPLDAPGEMTNPALLATGGGAVLDGGTHRWRVV